MKLEFVLNILYMVLGHLPSRQLYRRIISSRKIPTYNYWHGILEILFIKIVNVI